MKSKKLRLNSKERKFRKIEKNGNLVNNRAITLISLVITIILLIILAGVVINLSIGENGLFNKTKQAKEKYTEVSAREKIETTLAEALIEKETNEEYNSEGFLDNVLTNDGILVNANVVTVNNYNFIIDREKLKIIESLGETAIKVKSEVQEYLGKNGNDKYRVSSLVTIESNIKMESIKITNPDKTTITLTTDKTMLAKDMEMELDQEYIVEVKGKNGQTIKGSLVEKSEEKINSVEEFIAFRDKVNSGLTYEGKTISLIQDLNLESICGENVSGETISFEPIGNSSKPFKGKFDGNNHSIKNIFINKYSDYNGLFGCIGNAEIKNLKLDEGSISNGAFTGGICGGADNSTIYNCINNAKVEGTNTSTGGITGVANNNTIIEQCANLNDIVGTNSTGGIAAQLGYDSKIINSYNTGNINSKESGSHNSRYISGGIAAYLEGGNSNKIENCYNIGNIYGRTNTGGIIGLHQNFGNDIIDNCYSIGILTGNSRYAIVGERWRGEINPNNNYWLIGCGASSGSYSKGNTGATPKSETEMQALASTLGEAYTNDEKIKVIDEETGEEKEVWKYNNGYPILKWQKN